MKTFKDFIFSFKPGTIIVMIVCIISVVTTISTVYSSLAFKMSRLEIRQDHVAELYESTKEKYTAVQEKQYQSDMIIIEIKTKLTWIEAMLVDIKQQLIWWKY